MLWPCPGPAWQEQPHNSPAPGVLSLSTQAGGKAHGDLHPQLLISIMLKQGFILQGNRIPAPPHSTLKSCSPAPRGAFHWWQAAVSTLISPRLSQHDDNLFVHSEFMSSKCWPESLALSEEFAPEDFFHKKNPSKNGIFFFLQQNPDC